MTRPIIVCLCGSTRFMDWFQRANLLETLDGKIVLTVASATSGDAGGRPEAWVAMKQRLDALHRAKVELADEVLVLNVGGYVGDSTRGEVAHARAHGKRVWWLEPSPEAWPGEGVRWAREGARDAL